jgi:hypothetical protein
LLEVRQLDISHFQKPLHSETQSLDTGSPPPSQEILPPVKYIGNQTYNQTPDPLDIQQELIAPPKLVPLQLRPFVAQPDLPAPLVASRSELLAILTANIPRNEYSLPTMIYRPDLLDHTMFQDVDESKFDQLLEFLAAATIPLAYYEGYPALPDGSPLWAQFEEWESREDYALFEKYSMLPGARQLALLTGLPTKQSHELFHNYYWGIRAQASDAFAVAHAQRMREQRIIKTDDKHFLEAEKLLTKVLSYAQEINWESLKEEPDKYMNVVTKIVAMQRQALGISLQHTRDVGNKAAQPIELTMQSLTQRTTTTIQGTNGQPIINAEGEITEELDIREILAKAPDVSGLQELILRMGAPKK